MFARFVNGIINSYAQVFFSKSKILAIIILLVTLLHYQAGLTALLTVIFSQLILVSTGLDEDNYEEGLFGLNNILVGLCLSQYFSIDVHFFLLIAIASFLSTFISVWLVKWFSQKSLPFLSFPFLFTVWIMLLAIRSYDNIQPSENGIYIYNLIYSIGGNSLIDFIDQSNALSLPAPFEVYFKSMGAIFFQQNALTGIILATGLFFYSRISFLLSIIGFLGGYYYSQLLGEHTSSLLYSNIGFNFILSAIALGGFFIIPSIKSFLFALSLTPLIGLLNSSFTQIFSPYGLPIYSLPFNVIVLLVLSVLEKREKEVHLILTRLQRYIPEKNLYSYSNYQQRKDISALATFELPFIGEWRISQGYDGIYTHQLDWRFALDFDCVDNTNTSYYSTGKFLNQYYAYERSIISPCDGIVTTVVDHIPDNLVGTINQKDNWGNTIIIKHKNDAELYCQLSHLKQSSIVVKVGQKVLQGDLLALQGNSGRSPYPHLHFQIQRAPFIGAKSIDFPLSNFLVRKSAKEYELISSGIPNELEQVSRISIDDLLANSFAFNPGTKIDFEQIDDKGSEQISWQIHTDLQYNINYLYCSKTKSSAYFKVNRGVFLFIDFYGDKNSLLYYFYLAAYKVILGAYPKLVIKENVMLHNFLSIKKRFFHDLIAPFFMLYTVEYESTIDFSLDANNSLSKAVIRSEVRSKFKLNQRKINAVQFEISCENGKIQQININHDGKKILAQCV